MTPLTYFLKTMNWSTMEKTQLLFETKGKTKKAEILETRLGVDVRGLVLRNQGLGRNLD